MTKRNLNYYGWVILLFCIVYTLSSTKQTKKNELDHFGGHFYNGCELFSSIAKCYNKDSFIELSLDFKLNQRIQTLELFNFELNLKELYYLSKLTKLQSLKLKNVTTLLENILSTSTSLQHLDLSDNGVQTIGKSFLSTMGNIKTLSLENNPFHCDCHLLWLSEWLLSSHGKLIINQNKQDRIQCASPLHLSGHSVAYIHTNAEFKDSCKNKLNRFRRDSDDDGTRLWSCIDNNDTQGSPKVVLFTRSSSPSLSNNSCEIFCRLIQKEYYSRNGDTCHCGDAVGPTHNDIRCQLRCTGSNPGSNGCSTEEFPFTSEVTHVALLPQSLRLVANNEISVVTENPSQIIPHVALTISYEDSFDVRQYFVRSDTLSITRSLGRIVTDTDHIILPTNIDIKIALAHNISSGTIEWTSSNKVISLSSTSTTCLSYGTVICALFDDASVVSSLTLNIKNPTSFKLFGQLTDGNYINHLTVNFTFVDVVSADNVAFIPIKNSYFGVGETRSFIVAVNTSAVDATLRSIDGKPRPWTCNAVCQPGIDCLLLPDAVCYFSENITFNFVAFQIVTAIIRSTVMDVTHTIQWEITVERKITSIVIDPQCSTELVVGENKTFVASTDGNNVNYQWIINGQLVTASNNILTIEIKESTAMNVSVFAQNNISNKTASKLFFPSSNGYIHGISILVEEKAIPRIDVKCFIPPSGVIVVTVNKTTLFKGQLCGGVDVDTQWSFGDGTSVIHAPFAKEVTHIYSTAGRFNVSLTANNSINSKNNVLIVAAFDEIKSFDVNFSRIVISTTENIIIEGTIASGSAPCFAYRINSGLWSPLLNNNKSFIFSTKFNLAGNYTICVEAQNAVSRSRLCAIYDIQETIDIVWSPPNFGLVGSEVIIPVQHNSGTNSFFTWDFDDGSQLIESFSTTTPRQASHIFNTEGDFNVTLSFYNRVTPTIILNQVISIRNSVLGFKIEHSPFVAINVPMPIILVYPNNTLFFYNYDGLVTNKTNLARRTELVLFSSIGAVHINITTWNEASATSFSSQIFVQAPVEDITLTINSSQQILEKVTDIGYVMQNSTATFTPGSKKGTNSSFELVFDDNTISSQSVASHMFSTLGLTEVTVIGFNNVSNLTNQFKIDVQVDLKLASIRISTIVQVAIARQATILVTGISATNSITYNWQIDPSHGNLDRQQRQTNAAQAVVTFFKAGEFPIRLIMSNKVSRVSIERTIRVENAVGGISVRFNGSNLDNSKDLIVASGVWGFQAITTSGTSLNFEWRLNNVIVSNDRGVNINLTNTGVYSLQLKVFNNVTSKVVDVNIQSLDMLSGLRIKGNSQQFVSTEELNQLEAIFDVGDNVSFRWFVDGMMEQQGPSHLFNRMYTAARNYSVKVITFSPVSNQHAASLVITAQQPILSLMITPTEVLINISTVLNASVSAGTDVSFSWFIDQRSLPGISATILASDPGPFIFTVTAWNKISNMTKMFNITAKPSLKKVKVETSTPVLPTGDYAVFYADIIGADLTYAWTINGDVVANETGPMLRIMLLLDGEYSIGVTASNGLSTTEEKVIKVGVFNPPDQPIIEECCNLTHSNKNIVLKGDVLSGSNVTYNWTVTHGDGNISYYTGKQIEISSGVSGNVTVELLAFNAVGNVTRIYSFLVLDEITDAELWTSQSIIPLGEEVTLSYLTRSGTGLRYTWALNGQPLNVGNVDTVIRRFTVVGNHTITASVINDLLLEPIVREITVSVKPIECPPPILSVQGSTERRMTKSSWLYTEAKVDFNCSAYSPVSSWTFHVADENTRCQYDQNLALYIMPRDDLVVSSPLLAIPPGSFALGIYCTRYTMIYGSTGQFERMVGIRIEVLPTPLVPRIIGGNKRKYAHNDTIVVDGSQTIDPDLEINGVADLEYRWVSDYINASSVIAPLTVRFNTSWSNRSSMVLPPNNILPGRAYKVDMFVRRKGRDKVEHTSQTVIIEFGTVPLIDITCITCSAYKTLKYAKSRSLKFSSNCINCGGFDASFLSFKWTILDDAGQMLILADNETTTGLSSQLLIINSGVLDGTQDYQFQIELSLGSVTGSSSVTLFPNQSPQNGSCIVSPSIGYSFVTMFNFTCYDWQDVDNTDTPFLTWIIADSAAGKAIVYRGIQSTIGTQLSSGNTSLNGTVGITILIEDAFGALTVGYNGSVQVFPPPNVVNVNEFLEAKINNELLGLAEAKDSNKVLAFVQSGATLLGKGDDNSYVLSNLVKAAAGIRSSSMEGIEQTMRTAKIAVNAGREQSLDFDTRTLLTNSLDEVVTKLSEFSSRGFQTSEIASEAVFDIFSNNFGGLEQFGKRKQSLLLKSSHSLLEFYKSQLQTISIGENARILESPNIYSRLQRSKPNEIAKERSRNGCNIRSDIDTLNKFEDVLEIFESSSVDQFPNIDNVSQPSSQLCRLAYYQPNKQAIQVKDLPDDKAIEIIISQTKAPIVNDSIVSVNVSSGGIRNGGLNLIDSVKGEAVHIEIKYTSQSVNGSVLFEVLTRNEGESLNTSIVLQERMYYESDGSFMIFIPQSDFNPDLIHSLRITNNFTADVTISASVYTSSCLFWNTTLTDWDTSGCYVSNASSREQTKCICNHLTSFSALFKLKPNPIDFSLLLKLDIASNPVALSVCLGVIALFFIIFAISFRTDEKERRNDHYIPFLGPDEFFKYEIKVTTGGQIGAGTTARVGIQIFGRRARTKSRLLFKDGGLKRNSVDIFQFASGKGLGNIHKIRVWHDNSGADPSWHVKSIIIKNLLDGRKYFFFCNSWLALDTEGGVIEKDFSVASKQMIRQFSLIFDNVVGRAFHDHHLWLSVLQRPTLSSFTRVQRVACCFTLILSYMAINAMWFGVAPDGDVDIFLGFRGFSYEEVFIGIISSLMVFPLNIFLVFLFRKSKPRGYKKYDAFGEVKMFTLKGRRRYSLESIEVDDLRRKPSEASEELEEPLRRCKTKINLGAFRLPLLYRGDQYYSVLPESNITDIDADQPVFDEPNEPHTDNNTSRTRDRSLSGPHVQFVDTDPDLETPLMPAPPPEDISDTLINRTRDRDEEMAENFELFCRAVEHAREVSQVVEEAETAEAIESNETSNSVNPETQQEMRRLFEQFQSGSISGQSTSGSETENVERSQNRFHDLPEVEYSVQHKKYLDEMDDLPDVYERPSNMHGPLPSWCNLVAYFLCLGISGFSIVLILIYGQGFGRKKAVKWVTALLVGLLQDMFITYPVILVTGAAIMALIVKPTNLDYGDFVECPVVPGLTKLKDNVVNPLRGLALQSAKREGLRKHRLRVIVKRAAFLLVFSWLVLSVFITSFQPTTVDLKSRIINDLDSGDVTFTSIRNTSEFWSWSENTLWPFLESTTNPNEEWAMIGSAQLRQLRIGSNVSCDPSSQLTCHVLLDDNSEQTNDVINGNWAVAYHSGSGAVKNPAWSYKTDNGESRTISGTYQSYPSDRGYLYSFSDDNFAGAKAEWTTLKNLNWIDSYSNAVFIDLILHNRNITDTYAVVSLLMENSLSGFVFTKIEVRIIVSELYSVNLDYFKLACEVAASLIFLYLWLKLIISFFKYGFKISIRRHSMIFLLGMCILSLVYIVISIYRVAMLAKMRSDLKSGYPLDWEPSLPDAVAATVTVVLGIIAILILFKVVQLLSWLRNYVLVSFSYKKAVGYLFLTAFFVTLLAVGFTSYGYAMFDDSYRYRENPLDSVFDRILLSWSSDNRWRFSTYHYIYAITWNFMLYSMYIGVILTYISAFCALAFKDFHRSYPRQADNKDRLLMVYIWRRMTGKIGNVGFSEISSTPASTQTQNQQGNLFVQSRVFSTNDQWNYTGNGNANGNGGPPHSLADMVAEQDREEIRRDEFYGAMERQTRSQMYGLTLTETPL